jgi:type II secretory pathway component GspD/PulD (secretin)
MSSSRIHVVLAIAAIFVAGATPIAFAEEVAAPPSPAKNGLEFQRFAGKSRDALAEKAGGPTERIEVQSTTDHIDYVVKVYRLEHANSAEVFQLIQNAVALEGGFVERIAAGSQIEIRAEAGVNYRYSGESYLIVTAPEWMIRWLDDAIAALDVEGIEKAAYGTGYYFYRPRHRRPTEIVELVSGSSASGSENFIPDDSRNVLYIEDTPSFLGGIIEAIEHFDQPQEQVECLLRIFEIEESQAEDVGLDWQAWKRTIADGSLDFEWGDPGRTDLNLSSLTANLSFTPALASEFLNYLAARGNARVVTDTRLSVVNGRTATLDSSTSIPFVVRNQFGGVLADQPQIDSPFAVDGDGLLREFYEGVTVEISPTIGQATIEFDVTASVSSHLGYTPNQSVPIIQSSSVTSSLDLEIGKPACLTGLTRVVRVEERTGVPLLMDVPFLGGLFSREVVRDQKSHLCVVLSLLKVPAPIHQDAIPTAVPWSQPAQPLLPDAK